MDVTVVLTPAYLGNESLADKTVVVFDVLRATTTITSAFAAGIPSIHVFAELDDAKRAAASTIPRPLLIGELNALPAPGVDLGNSPRQFTKEHAGRVIFMATTNGTKAMTAARTAAKQFTGALVNVSAVSRAALDTGRSVLLLGSGTAGAISMEDTIGAGAVCQKLSDAGYFVANDTARIARRLFLACQDNLPTILRETQGGRNNIKVGLDADIAFAAQVDYFDIVGEVDTETLVIRPMRQRQSPRVGE
jgi:2-phosphosulfolactate phosphatase